VPAAEDERRCMLLLIDMQIDFIHPVGSLTVPGAVDDTCTQGLHLVKAAETITV